MLSFFDVSDSGETNQLQKFEFCSANVRRCKAYRIQAIAENTSLVEMVAIEECVTSKSIVCRTEFSLRNMKGEMLTEDNGLSPDQKQ